MRQKSKRRKSLRRSKRQKSNKNQKRPKSTKKLKIRSKRKSYLPVTNILLGSATYLLFLGGLAYIIYKDKGNVDYVDQNDWICKNFKNKLTNEEILENYSYADPILDFKDYFSGNENIQNNLKNFRTIYTIGDGTCLIHSFLTSTSPDYRRLDYDDKGTAGIEFRTYLSRIIEDNDLGTNHKIYIDDNDIQLISNFYKINFLFFWHGGNIRDIRPIYVNNDNDNQYNWIISYNTENNHFSSVSLNNKFILDKSEVIQDIINFRTSKLSNDAAVVTRH